MWSIYLARAWRTLRQHRIQFGLLFAALSRSGWERSAVDNRHMRSGPESILVIRLDAIGDLVMTTPVFQGLKVRYPNAKITAVIQEANRDLLTTNPYVDRVIHPPTIHRTFMFRGIRREFAIFRCYWKEMRKEHFDIAFEPRVGPDFYEANLLLRLVAAPLSMNYLDDSQKGLAKIVNRFALRAVIRLPAPRAQHEVLSSADLLERLTGHILTPIPEIFLTANDQTFAEAVGQGLRYGSTIVSIAFGAQSMKRSWPLERWAEVVRILSGQRELSVILVCSKAERREGEYLLSLLNVRKRLVSGAGLREAAACISKCDLFVGTDSGLAHMAAAVGCPTLVVSPHPLHGDEHSPNSPVRFRPWSEHTRVVQPDVGMCPCLRECEAVERHCILQVTSERIAQVCIEMLHSGTHRVGAKVGV